MDPKSATQDVEKGKSKKDDTSPPVGDDPSVKIWNLSLTRASEHDAAMVDRWKSDMDGILIYTGVFSATVAAFLIESYKSLKPDSSDVTADRLQQVIQGLASISVGSPFSPTDLEPFKVKRAFIHVNILWFLSLCLSLACGLFATLVQQWLRRYLRLTQLSDDPIIRVRIRTFLFEGIHGFHVSWVVENVSVLLHAAIFLFFAGLVEFLFAFNDEVADVILVAVSVLAALYIFVTILPLIRRHCPFQTPLTTILWYTGHLLAAGFLHLLRCFVHIRARIDELWGHYLQGIDRHLLGMMEHKIELDAVALETTLSMCGDDAELEAFVDAIPGYLQDRDSSAHDEPEVETRISNIASLLKPKTKPTGKESSLRHRLVNLFASCTKDHRRMDEGTRRRRAIVCSRAIWEMARVSLSIKPRGVILGLPKSIGYTLYRMTTDSDSEIKASALRTHALYKRALLEEPADVDAEADKEKDHDHLKAIVAALPEVVGSRINPPTTLTPSPSYQAEPYSYKPLNERLRTVTDYTSNILVLIPNLDNPSHMDLEETRMTLEELCRELNGRDFSDAEQEHLFRVLIQVSDEHSALREKGEHPSEKYYVTIKSSTSLLVSTLKDEFAIPLQQRGYQLSGPVVIS